MKSRSPHPPMGCCVFGGMMTGFRGGGNGNEPRRDGMVCGLTQRSLDCARDDGDSGTGPSLPEGDAIMRGPFRGYALEKDAPVTSKLKLIHVGLGGWGMDWEKTALKTIADRVETVAIVEAFEPALEKAQQALKLKKDQCFATLEDALERGPEADAVLITAPMEAHVPLAITAMRAGKHVLVEKPLAGSVEEAIEAVQVAEETGLVFQ